jgi:hypothetical protein
MKIIRNFVLFSVLIILWGCSPEKQLIRLQRKHPHLFKTQADTFIIQGKIDTLYYYTKTADTIYRYDSVNNISEKLFYFRDTFRYYYKAQPCTTVIQQKNIPIIKPQEKKNPDHTKFLTYIIVILSLAVIWKLLK